MVGDGAQDTSVGSVGSGIDGEEVEREAVFKDADAVRRANPLGEASDEFGAGGRAVGVQNAMEGVSALTSERERFIRGPIEPHAPAHDLIDGRRAFLDQVRTAP